MTGGRIRRLKKYLIKEDNCCLTYADGVSEVNLKKSVDKEFWMNGVDYPLHEKPKKKIE